MKTTKFFLAIIIATVSFSFYSCKAPEATASATVVKKKYTELKATKNGFEKGNSEISGPIKKNEIDGRKIMVSGSFTITPESTKKTYSKDENGALVRIDSIRGEDPLMVDFNSIFLAEESIFSGGNEKYPDSIHVSILSEKGKKFCIPFALNSEGGYSPVFDYRVKTKKVTTYKKVWRDKYVYRKDQKGIKRQVFSRKNGKLIPKKKRVLEKQKKEEKKKVRVIITGKSGYRYTSPCDGKKYYINKKDIKLLTIWVDYREEDTRTIRRAKKYANPNGG